MRLRLLVALLPICLQHTATALSTTVGSPCTEICEAQNKTEPADLVCIDSEYTTKTRGKLMVDCLDCMKNSTFYSADANSPKDNDVYDFLYNMQYTIGTCIHRLYGNTKQHVPNFDFCNEFCEGMEPEMEQKWVDVSRANQWDYCTTNDSAFSNNARQCASCHQSFEGSVVLGNFLEAMIAGCDQQPVALDGETIKLTRSLFDLDPIADDTYRKLSASATSTPTASATAGASTSTPLADDDSAPSQEEGDEPSTEPEPESSSESSSSGLSAAATGGIGAAAGVAGIALIGGAVFMLFRRRRRRQQQQQQEGQAEGGIAEAPWFNKSGQHQGLLSSPQPPPFMTSPGGKYTTVSQELDGGHPYMAELGTGADMTGRNRPPAELDSSTTSR